MAPLGIFILGAAASALAGWLWTLRLRHDLARARAQVRWFAGLYDRAMRGRGRDGR
jgi:hypothetical protein